MREQGSGDGLLLLRNSKDDRVYGYRAATTELQTVSEEMWNSATGDIANNCAKNRRAQATPGLYIDRFGHLMNEQTLIKTRGERVLAFSRSPSGTRIAVLSADDRLHSGPEFPFSGSGPPVGQHYHELLSVPDLRPMGVARPVAVRSAERSYQLCWSNDEHFVVYADLELSHVCIVPIER